MTHLKNWLPIAILSAGISTLKAQENLMNQNLNNPKMESKVITIVKSKAPWYGFNFLLNSKFREVIPTYQKVDGLKYKAFSINNINGKKYFGGIYLWDNKQKAENWYTPKWFEDIRKKRGVIPIVEYFTAISDTSFLNQNEHYPENQSKCVALFLHSLSEPEAKTAFKKQEGLFRAYLVLDKNNSKGVILFFISKGKAELFLKTYLYQNTEWFKVPVLLSNQVVAYKSR